MKTFQEIKATNKDGNYYAIGSNGERYDASFDASFGIMFFAIPESVEIVGYIER